MKLQQSGQALPLGMALLLAGTIMGVVLFNTGQVVNEKTRLANSADAAVYSGALWQARALNFNAYVNRAMVANQVAMAQAVSLQSWAQYARTATGNISTVLSPVPIVGQIAASTNQAMRAFEPIVNGVGNGMLAVIDPINTALSLAQEAMYLSAFVASPEIVGKIAQANDSRLTWESAFSVGHMANNMRNWQSFTDQHETSDDLAMDERVAMINASTDQFTRDRSWNFFRSYLPLTPLNWARLERDGETRLLRDPETGATEWKAIDTLSLSNKFYYWFRKYKKVEVPIGYSMKFANDQEESVENCTWGGRNDCEDWFGRSKTAQRLARHVGRDLAGSANEAKSSMAYRGVRAYRSLSASIRADDNPSLVLRTELRLPLDVIRDAKSKNIALQHVDGVESSDESVLSSISSAEIYFNRPRDDAKEEFASGYNPFWAVRLASTTSAQRVASLALRGSGAVSFVPAVSLSSYDGGDDTALLPEAGAASGLATWSPALVGESTALVADSAGTMSDVLTDVLDNALERLMGSILPGGMPSIDSVANETMAGIDVEGITATVEEVHAEIDELREHYRMARETIQAEFEESANQLQRDTNARREEIDQRIAELEGLIAAGAGELSDGYQSEIITLTMERDGINGEGGLNDTLRTQMAEELVAIVRRVLPEWPIRLSQALHTVDQYLKYAADIANGIGLDELFDVEDDINE